MSSFSLQELEQWESKLRLEQDNLLKEQSIQLKTINKLKADLLPETKAYHAQTDLLHQRNMRFNGQLKSQLEKVSLVSQELVQLDTEHKSIHRIQQYLVLNQEIETQTNLAKTLVNSTPLEAFQIFFDLFMRFLSLRLTPCRHLTVMLQTRLLYLSPILKTQLATLFKKELKDLNWPQTSRRPGKHSLERDPSR